MVDLELDSYRNRRPNLLKPEFKLSTIQFGLPNCLSLVSDIIDGATDMIVENKKVNNTSLAIFFIPTILIIWFYKSVWFLTILTILTMSSFGNYFDV